MSSRIGYKKLFYLKVDVLTLYVYRILQYQINISLILIKITNCRSYEYKKKRKFNRGNMINQS